MTKSRILKVGIAGYGIVGKRRRHYIDLHPSLKTVAVSDQAFEGRGVLDDGVTYCSDFRDLNNKALDVIFVCLSNDVTAEATIRGLQSGFHVFCEKPPGRNVEEIRSVLSVYENLTGLVLKYGFNHRYHDSVSDAIGIINSKDLGNVINLRGVYGKSKLITYGQKSDWRTKRKLAGGGILLDQGIHMVDLIRLFGGEFEKVYSIISNDYWNLDVEDNAYGLMQSNEGIVAMLHSSATQWRHRFNLDITLEKGSLSLTGILSGSKSYGAESLTIAYAGADDRGDPIEETRQYDYDPSWEMEIAEFYESIENNQPVLHGSPKDALKTMELVYNIYCADEVWKNRWNLTDGS